MVQYFSLIITALVTVYSYSAIITEKAFHQTILQKTDMRQNQNNLKQNQLKLGISQIRLNQLRKIMKQKNIDVYILPRTDQNLSEYICEQDKRVQFLSNYHGTYIDIAVIKKNQAQMWTTNITGERFLEQGWNIKDVKNTQTWAQNLLDNFESKINVQIDGRLISATQVRILKYLFEDTPITIQFSERNLVDQIWINKPQPKRAKIYLHQKWAGKSMSEKVNWVRGKIKIYQADAALFGDLGQISWILNLRSSQLPYSPYFKSYLFITLEGGTLHLPNDHPAIYDTQIVEYLNKQNIKIKQFDFIFPKKILTQPSTINYLMFSKIEKPIGWEGIGMFRAIRTDKQIQSFKKSKLRDGVAMVKFWAWIANQEQVNEYDAATYLDNLRRQQQNNMGISFPTISAAGQNAALMHYIPNKKNSSMINKNKLFMVDSGGQYLEGTTDTTRTFHFGIPSQEEKDSYTRVLLGNLGLQRVVWREYRMMTGQYLDRIARKYLSAKQLSYTHPTGHGVGFFGSVHQGPIGIGPGKIFDFRPNMIVTNQPGYYEPGKYGIRIQNMLAVIKKSEDDLTFQNLTLCPYNKNLLDRTLLKEKDIEFINNYHNRVWKQLSPLLKQDEQTLNWLKIATEPIQQTKQYYIIITYIQQWNNGSKNQSIKKFIQQNTLSQHFPHAHPISTYHQFINVFHVHHSLTQSSRVAGNIINYFTYNLCRICSIIAPLIFFLLTISNLRLFWNVNSMI